MNSLSVDVASIGAKGHVFEACVLVTSIQPPASKAMSVDMVTVSGRFDCLGEDFLFRGHISGVYEGACFRCLEPARAAFDVEVAWVFAEGPAAVFEEIGHALDMDAADFEEDNPSSEERRSFQGRDINLAPFVWEEVVFAQPSRYLCREACAGLCPHCGENLNERSCACADVQDDEITGNHGLADLAKLFPDLAPKQTKE